MANDANEEFWGCTLSKDKKEYVWDPSAESEEDVEHKLQLTTACLGAEAREGERNLVAVTTENDNGKKITCPILSLRIGSKECMHLDLGFTNTTKFKLTSGTGPLSLCGVHLQALPLDFDEEDSDDEEAPALVPTKLGKELKRNNEKVDTKKPEDKKIEKVEDKKVNKKKEEKPSSPAKRPATNKKDEQPAKKKKVEEPEEDDSDDDEEEMEDESDDEEEDSEEEEMPSLLDGEAVESSGDDSEEGDEEPEDGDDIDSEEDEDEDMDSDEDDESGEEDETPVKTKKKVNGIGPAKSTTPAKGAQQQKKDKNTPVAVKKTPGKKDNTPKPSQAKKTPDEIKAHLLKSPNLPKKFDKFSNFMKNNMKVTDATVQKEFWDYVQKNKK